MASDQLALFGPEPSQGLPVPPFAPLPSGSAHYVAALQNRPGELDALKNASEDTWSRFTPVLHVVGPKKSSGPLNAPNITEWMRKIHEAVGSHPMFLDIMRLRPNYPVVTGSGKTVPALERIYWAARRRGLMFVPVAWLGESDEGHVRFVAAAAELDGRGVGIRCRIRSLAPPPAMTPEELLNRFVAALSVDVSSTDLLIDLDYLDPDDEIRAEVLGSFISRSLGIGEWRNIILLGTSIPRMLSCIPEGTVGTLPRREWSLWSAVTQLGLARAPSFGDYAIQHSRPPQEGASGGSVRANIRYTSHAITVIARGRGPVSQEGNDQYRGLCEQVRSRPEFSGCEYSWGDRVIEDCARGELAPGAQRMWRGAGTSHHLRFVTDQLAGARPAA